MPHIPSPITAPADDTPDAANVPVDERRPYAGRSRWRTVLAVGLAVAALVMAVVVAVKLVRRVFLLLFVDGPGRTRIDSEVIMVPDVPTRGLLYKVQFYDGTYEQLTDRDIRVVIDPAAPWEMVERQLASLAEQLAAEVYRRDSQVCFHPRVVLVNAAGSVVREWMAPTWA